MKQDTRHFHVKGEPNFNQRECRREHWRLRLFRRVPQRNLCWIGGSRERKVYKARVCVLFQLAFGYFRLIVLVLAQVVTYSLSSWTYVCFFQQDHYSGQRTNVLFRPFTQEVR